MKADSDLLDGLPRALREALEVAGRIARESGFDAYLVGGAVRDLLTGRPVSEIDVVIVGDAVAVASSLASELGGTFLRHEQFGTASVDFAAGRVDLVTARREQYAHPGALPTVTPGSIDDDLRRRDFTINALALEVPAREPRLLDPTRGLDDLRDGLIRVLNESSFQDDATRALRAIRYEQRLRFNLESQTETWLCRDLAYLDKISGDRLRRELDRWWQEDSPERAFERGEALGIWAVLSPGLRYETTLNAAFLASRALGGPLEALRARGLALWTWTLTTGASKSLLERLRMPAEEQRACHDASLLRDRFDEIPSLPNSLLARLLTGLHPEAINAAWIVVPLNVRSRIDQFRHSLSSLKPTLRGPDLELLGVPRGPALGRALQRLQDARWDGAAETRDDEERLVLHWLSEPGGIQ
jgi:tRNA nucleotidyltransferase (CCA-adding enzyme)